ncbi:MAG TPA: hypothetical protein VNX68_05645, partial [Nitrosopumilaceae archaeon]|nr:hypothetical protein [Nitrosopumilaceae archaeon]
SPYFYKRTIPDQGITSDEHGRNIQRFIFKSDGSRNSSPNILKKNEYNEVQEFSTNGDIQFYGYLEHSLLYYYYQYYQDPKKNKKEWDFRDAYKSDDYSSSNGISKQTTPVGYMVLVMKVDGKEATSLIVLVPKNSFSKKTVFSSKLWDGNSNPMKEGDTYGTFDKASGKTVVNTVDKKDIPKEKIGRMANEEYFFPLYYYMKDHAKAGNHKIEIELYPAFVGCKKTSERSNELICKGEFILTLTQQDCDDMKEVGGPSCSPDVRVYCENGLKCEDKLK